MPTMTTVSDTEQLSPPPPRDDIEADMVLTRTQPDSPSPDQPQRRAQKPVRNRISRREQSKYACFRCQKKKTKVPTYPSPCSKFSEVGNSPDSLQCNRQRSHTRCEACIKRND